MSAQKQLKKCEQIVDGHLASRIDDLRQLWDAYCKGDEDGVEGLGNFHEYGLCFDYVAPETFREQEEGYFRYQLSWGGPGDEFRFYCNPDHSCHRIEYWHLDWSDGAGRTLTDEDKKFMLEIWEHFRECSAEYVYQQAVENV